MGHTDRARKKARKAQECKSLGHFMPKSMPKLALISSNACSFFPEINVIWIWEATATKKSVLLLVEKGDKIGSFTSTSTKHKSTE